MMRSKAKPKFKRGNVTFALCEEERLFLLKYVNKIQPKGELEERMATRLVRRCMRAPITNYNLYPAKECPICERTVNGRHFERHLVICKQRQKESRRLPKIDPTVWEMMGGRFD